MLINKCYGPYKQDSTSTKKRLISGQDQCTRGRTDGTRGAIGRGVAELYNKVQYVSTRELLRTL